MGKLRNTNILKPPTNYSGSKANLLPQMVKHFPNSVNVRNFYDVFCGGLSVSINIDYDKIIANDIITPLIEFYRNLQNAANCGEVSEEIMKLQAVKVDKTSKEDYYNTRISFNKTRDPYLFFALVSSCTNNMMRFNKKFQFNQSFGERTININTVQKIRNYCKVLEEKDIIFTSCNFMELFEEFTPQKNDFVYLDPPYAFITEAGYNAYWSKEDEENLYKLMEDLDSKGIRFALSGVSIHKDKVNPNMDKLSKYKIIELDHSYEKVARKKGGKSQEILVINY